MKRIALLFLALTGCTAAVQPEPCTPPATFVACDATPDGTPRCWDTDRTDWLLSADGSYVHEYRVGQGAEGPVLTTILCRGQR